MSSTPRPDIAPLSIDEIAADWILREQAGLDEAGRRDLRAWLDASPDHADAHDAMASAWSALDSIADDPAIARMRAEALQPAPARALWPRFVAIAASLLLVFATLFAGGLIRMPDDKPAILAADIYQTHKGQSSTIRLSDGSVVTLDTDSAVQVRLQPGRRDIMLTRGRAYFQVAHDGARPFVVTAGNRSVIAVGTEFDVSTDPRRIEVTLTQGKVLVQSSELPASFRKTAHDSVALVPGQQLVFDTASRRTTVRQGDLASLTAWRMGRLRFDSERLADAVDEINRYSPRPLRLADASLAEMRVSGVFRTDQPENFTTALTTLFPVRAETANGETLLLRRDRALK